jgi:hypothetical protein
MFYPFPKSCFTHQMGKILPIRDFGCSSSLVFFESSYFEISCLDMTTLEFPTSFTKTKPEKTRSKTPPGSKYVTTVSSFNCLYVMNTWEMRMNSPQLFSLQPSQMLFTLPSSALVSEVYFIYTNQSCRPWLSRMWPHQVITHHRLTHDDNCY